MLSTYARLWNHIGKTRRNKLAWLVVVIALASLAEIASISAILPFLGVLMSPEKVLAYPLMQPIIKLLAIKHEGQLLLPLTILFIMAVLISAGMRLFVLLTQTRLAFSIGADISYQIYQKSLYQSYAVHVARNSSEVIAGISGKTNTVIYSFLLPVLHIISSGLILLTILAVLIAINPIIALFAFGSFGSLYGLIVLATKKRLAQDSMQVSRESIQVVKALQEGLGGIRDVLIDGTQAIYCQIYRKADLPMRRSQANIEITSASPRFLMEALGMTLIAFLAFGLAQRDAGISSAIPVLGALALAAQRLLPVLQQIYASWTSIRGSQASLLDVVNLLDQPLPEPTKNSNCSPLEFKKSIYFDNVKYRYNDETPWILSNISFEIRKGSRIGFVGMTGSGKSTLLDLIMGLLLPNEGKIFIDGIPLTTQNYRAWQSHIAHVPQSIFLADATIYENIAFGVPKEKIDMDRVKSAADKARISDVIESWHLKYDTLVGERGIRLSGGQRQRIGIARALYKQADVIILDEATSALDSDTEQLVMESIEMIEKTTTVIIVAHRLSTLRKCDKIVELEEGRIKREVSYAEVAAFAGNEFCEKS